MFEFSINELEQILHTCSELLLEEPMLLELNIPPNGIYVVGDLNADVNQLYDIFQEYGLPPDTIYLFLGDYVGGDEEEYQIELILLLLLMKTRWPDSIFLLRGHKETYEYVVQHERFNEIVKNERLFFAFNMLFDVMPIAAIVGDRYLCCHSGVSQYMTNRQNIEMIKRPTYRKRMTLLSTLLFTDILHGCPDPTLREGRPFAASSFKPIGYRFNKTGLRMVLQALGGLRCLIRSHTFASNGLNDDFCDGTCFTFNSKESDDDNAHGRGSQEVRAGPSSSSQNKYCILLKADQDPVAVKLPPGTKMVGLKYNPLEQQIFNKFNSPFEHEDRFGNIQQCRFCNAKVSWTVFKKQRCITHPELYTWVRKNFGISALERQWRRSQQLRWYRSATIFPILYDQKFVQKNVNAYVSRLSAENEPFAPQKVYAVPVREDEEGEAGDHPEAQVQFAEPLPGPSTNYLPIADPYKLSDSYSVLPVEGANTYRHLIYRNSREGVTATTRHAQFASSLSRKKQRMGRSLCNCFPTLPRKQSFESDLETTFLGPNYY